MNRFEGIDFSRWDISNFRFPDWPLQPALVLFPSEFLWNFFKQRFSLEMLQLWFKYAIDFYVTPKAVDNTEQSPALFHTDHAWSQYILRFKIL